MEEEIRRRPFGPVVRVEIERAMPQAMRDLLQREFRFEESEQRSTLSAADFYEEDGMVDLGAVGALAAVLRNTSYYRAGTLSDTLPLGVSTCAVLHRMALRAHHTYDAVT